MLVTVYEVRRRSQSDQERHFSLNMMTDYTYWFHEHSSQDITLLVRSERMVLRDALLWQRERHRDKIHRDSHRSEGWMSISRDVWTREVSLSHGHIASSDGIWTEETLSSVADQLVGRRLLIEEVRQLCLDFGLARIDEEQALLDLIQRLVLRGAVRLDSGMRHRGRDQLNGSWLLRPWIKLKLPGMTDSQLRCGRCNSSPDNHYQTPCAICGRECVYCEACLQMGRVRECSIFVVGAHKLDMDEASGKQQ